MGKAAVDLPDPMQQPPPAGRTSTDDLLAQLAGEEIDRLLAEADGAHFPPAPAPAPPAPPPARSAAPAPVETHAPVAPAARPAPHGLFFDEPAPARVAGPEEAITGPAFEAAPAGAPVAQPSQISPEVGEELDALFSAAVERDLADEAHLAARNAAERAGLRGDAAGAGHAAALADANPPADGVEARPLPLILRPLEWMNAPLERLPAGARDLIGKIAIVTLINAAAVIAYVMLFRPR